MSSLWSSTMKHLPSYSFHTCCLKTSLLDIYDQLLSVPKHGLWEYVKGYFSIDVTSRIYFPR